MLEKALPRLERLQALCLSFTPAASDPGDSIPALSSMLRALQTLPLTRLSLSNAALAPAALNAICTLTGLQNLGWVPHWSRGAHEAPTAASNAAFASVLQSCTNLTALSLLLLFEPEGSAGAASTCAVLAPLRWLQKLELRFDQTKPGPLPPAQPAAEVDMPALQHLKLQVSSLSDLVPQLEGQACLRMRSLTLLHIKVDVSSPQLVECTSSTGAAAVQCRAVQALLQELPRLQELELPPELMQVVGGDIDATLGPVLQRLTRLERLVMCHRSVQVAKAVLPFVRGLPLRRGVA